LSQWSLSYFFSKEFLGSRWMLWGLFWTNLLGTAYGYIWYGNQLKFTIEFYPAWLLPFVPDSPTASLFFTWFLFYLLISGSRENENPFEVKRGSGLRSFVEAFAVVTSIKYGVWAVAMIFWGASQGDPLGWQDWMLSISHLGMAAEALLYWRFFQYRWPAILLVAVWTFSNDYMDYGIGIYPWLPDVLEDDLSQIAAFSIGLTVACVILAVLLWIWREKSAAASRKSV
jgi:uncharacterized membrane protein YpjA